MLIDVLTIFPGMFEPVMNETLIKRAQAKGLLKVNVHDLRAYSDDSHRKVDAPPYGGGQGMVFSPQPVFKAVESLLGYPVYPAAGKDPAKRIILFSPQGRQMNQKMLRQYLAYERLILIAPRYEGIDERVRRYCAEEEISLGDYILSGAELAGMVFIDCLTRLIPGVVSSPDSIVQESFENGLLDYPVYTRPQDFRGLKVPDELMSGDHKKIEEWRKRKAEEITRCQRPDLWEKYDKRGL